VCINVIVPVFGESISSAVVAKWYRKVGDVVRLDDLLLELETEKAIIEIHSSCDGILTKILKVEGDEVSVAEVLAIIN